MRTLGRRLLEGWLRIAAHFGEIQTLLIVCVIYVLVLGPMAVGAAALRLDLLKKRDAAEGQSAWAEADTTSHPDLERAQRLF